MLENTHSQPHLPHVCFLVEERAVNGQPQENDANDTVLHPPDGLQLALVQAVVVARLPKGCHQDDHH
jgi:hypothetical protein